MPGRFNGRVNAFGAAQGQQLGEKFMLKQRLAAGNRHTAAGFLVKGTITSDGIHDRCRCREPASQNQCTGTADIRADAAAIAQRTVDLDRASHTRQGTSWAMQETLTTADAFGRILLQLVFW
jgi:hypothetical protein